jgi:hypothetical protein
VFAEGADIVSGRLNGMFEGRLDSVRRPFRVVRGSESDAALHIGHYHHARADVPDHAVDLSKQGSLSSVEIRKFDVELDVSQTRPP